MHIPSFVSSISQAQSIRPSLNLVSVSRRMRVGSSMPREIQLQSHYWITIIIVQQHETPSSSLSVKTPPAQFFFSATTSQLPTLAPFSPFPLERLKFARLRHTDIEMNERAPNATLHNLTLIQRGKAEYEALKSYLCFMYYVKCHNMITRTGYFPPQFACLHISKSPMPLDDDDDDDCLSSGSMFIAARLVYCVHSSDGVRKSHTENWKFVRRQCKAQKCKLELTYRKKRGVVKCQTNWICFFLLLLQHEISRS